MMSGFKLLVRDAFYLDLHSKPAGAPSLEFEVCAAITDGKGNALGGGGTGHLLNLSSTSSSRGWTSTGYDGATNVPPPDSVPTDGDWDAGCGGCEWDEVLDLGAVPGVDVGVDSFVEISLRRDSGRLFPSREVGRTRTTVGELLDMSQEGQGRGVELMMFDLGPHDDDGDVVATVGSGMPTIVRVSVVPDSVSEELAGRRNRATTPITPPPLSPSRSRSTFAKRLMVVTRGTRGDVQPFVALARGLAEMRGWEVIIVTELGYKSGIAAHAGVERGAIRWRPSGGDTPRRVNAKLSQRAINLKLSARQTDGMQKLFLARSECEFFPSEPAVYYWAKKMRPDCLMFGFTMASITLLVSEALHIPVVGFVLQPTCIPSKQYPPILPLREEDFDELTKVSISTKHKKLQKLKYYQDNANPLGNTLRSLRERRGLEAYKSYRTNTWQELRDKNFPLVVPINEDLFGGKPDDWSDNAVFTDSIFLRGGSVPPLADDATRFLDGARAMDRGRVVVLAFSSMPVGKSQIVSIALRLIRECTAATVCVFALVGGQLDLRLDDKRVREEADDAVESGRLFLAAGAPFGRLFPLVDAVVLHGGLGTTSEALQAGKPAIVTGVMLLDQRFWGSRCAELNVGPFGTHVDDFYYQCVEYVDRALGAGAGAGGGEAGGSKSEWRENAETLGRAMTERAGDDPSGVRRNVECVVDMVERTVPYYFHGSDEQGGEPQPESERSEAEDPSLGDDSIYVHVM